MTDPTRTEWFTLPVHGRENIDGQATDVVFRVTGILNSMGGIGQILCLAKVVDVDEASFSCKVDELDVIRELLEDLIQDSTFDRNRSSMVVVRSYEEKCAHDS